ncbi:MAG: hypothetical protein E6Q77_06640 [Rhizobium sp.]|nr:MAG: hypothetical protein E6Q77_06640 [Rhizobium sp.]
MFMIVDRATGMRLPAGGTKAEFSATRAPRLFHRRVDAINAMQCWREGRWRLTWGDPDDGAWPEPPRDTERNREIAAARKAMDIAVVEVRLEVIAL